jgi:hypothetical protein
LGVEFADVQAVEAQLPMHCTLPRNAAIATTTIARLQPANIFSPTLPDDLQEEQVAGIQSSDSVTTVVIPSATRVAATIVESVGIAVTPFISLMMLQFMALFLLVLPKRPAIAVIPTLFPLVLLEITLFITLVVPHRVVITIVVAVRLCPLSMDGRAAQKAYWNDPEHSLPQQLKTFRKPHLHTS